MIKVTPNFQGSTLALALNRAIETTPYAGENDVPVFSPDDVENMLMRRLNPLASLKAATLTAALDAFDIGDLAPAARLWAKMADRERWLKTVKDKREEAIELRPHMVEATDESPEAKDQQAVIEALLSSVRATHAMDRHITGGFSLLRRQMMESVSYKYAVHHLRWQPDAMQTFDLPSGRAVPGLKLTCEYVPLEYFEARTGALRFLGSDVGYTGKELADGRWMTTTGPALMIAASLAVYEGRLSRHDRLNLSEKWGQPGVLGHTTGAKNSDQGKSMKSAVASVASNYRGVLYGSDRNAIEFTIPSGGSGVSTTPMKEIMEDVKREVTTLYLGGDLSTISAKDSVGANLQGDAENDRQRADCMRLEETLNTTIVPLVIRWYFGPSARVLAKIVIEAPDNEDRKTLAEAVKTVVDLGGQVPVAPVAKRLGVPIAKAGDIIFQKAAPQRPGLPAFNSRRPSGQYVRCANCQGYVSWEAEPEVSMGVVACPKCGSHITQEGKLASNAEPRRAGGNDPQLQDFLAKSSELISKARAADAAPLRRALAAVLQGPDETFAKRLAAFRDEVLTRATLAAPETESAFSAVLGTSLLNGLTDEPAK